MTTKTGTPRGNVASNAEAKETKLIRFNRATYGEVIRYYRLKLGLNTVQFAEKIHSSKNNVCNWETGRARPDINLLPGICAGLGISIGKFFGLPSTDKELSTHEQRLLSHYNSLSPENQKLVDTMIDTMLESQDCEFRVRCEQGFERIFHNDNCSAAGIGYALSDQVRGEYVYIRTSRNACLADEIITVSGDSMEPTLHDGDDLFVEHTSVIEPGEIGIFTVGGDGYVKEYQPDGLHSHNPAYPVMKFCEDDHVRCVGRVLGVVEKEQYPTREEAAMLEEIRRERREVKRPSSRR